MRFIIDTWAWVEYLLGGAIGEKVGKIIENESNEIFTSVITIAEITSMSKREQRDPEIAYNHIISLSKVYSINEEISKEAGLVHADMRKKIKDLGLADSFILVSAKRLSAKIVTGDKHFKNFKNVVFIGNK